MSTVSSLEVLLTPSDTPEVGTLTHLDYHSATVVTNDDFITQVGGVPRYSFLLAVPPQADELILLRVEGVAPLQNDRDLKILRESLLGGQVDATTRNRLQTMGLSCKVVGSFYDVEGELRFGSDLELLLAYASYRVVKPRGGSLSAIASYTRPNPQGQAKEFLDLGVVRYSESNRRPDPEAKLFIDVRDFLGKKTAFFGTTRSGKSNTMKVIAKRIFEHSKKTGRPIGQLIFDPQGEYANENVQDNGSLAKVGTGKDVVIYRAHLKNEGNEKALLLNFLEEENLQLLWDLMLLELENGMSAKANYTAGLAALSFLKPDQKALAAVGDPAKANYAQAMVHYQRKRLALYAFLKICRIDGPVANLFINVGEDHVAQAVALAEDNSIAPNTLKRGEVKVTTTGGAKLLFEWLKDEALGADPDSGDGVVKPRSMKKAGEVHVSTLTPSWVRDFQEGDLAEFVKQFDNYYAGRTGLVAAFTRLKPLHSSLSQGDMREHVWQDLEKGRIIIVDLSVGGSAAAAVALSELLVNSIVKHASDNFTSGRPSVKLQVMVEEAHNLFDRRGAMEDSTDPWVRLSKEASKYDIGLLYATQEVSSVDPRILSNTSNWIIAHLNSRSETHTLANYYGFRDWEEQIISSESKGFVRLKTESSPFIVPVQIHKFVAQGE